MATVPPAPLRIHALHVGTAHNWPTAALVHMRGFGQTADLPLIMFVITGGEHPVVVDTGGASPDEVGRRHGYDFSQTPEQVPAAALQTLGVDPADVRTVVNSHLHWDHSSNNDLFPNARIVVQRDELHYALDPEQPHRKAYERLGAELPTWMSSLPRFDVVDGDSEIGPQLTAIKLPGHSPGSQGVLVVTPTARYLIAGDCVGSHANWQGDENVDHHPSGTFTSLPDYMASFRRIEELDCTVIPSHDPAVLAEGVFV